MSSNSALNNLSKALLNGEYKGLAKQATQDLTSGKFNNKLFATSCMSTKLAFDMNMTNLAYGLEAKSKTGMNVVDASNYDKVVKTFKTKKLLRKHDITEDIVEFLKSDNCKISAKEEMASIVSNFDKDAREKDFSPLAPLFAYIVAKKVEATPENVDKILEVEKEIEPLVISLINNEKVNANLTTRALKEDSRQLLYSACANEEMKNKVDLFFHDMAVSAYVNTIVNKPEFVRMGIEKDSNMPMARVDAKGLPRTYFEHNHESSIRRTKFLTTKTKFSELLNGDKSHIYTALKLLQKRAGVEIDANTGKSTSRVANSDKAARILVEFAILCDKLGANIDNDLAFAIANPLIDLIASKDNEDIKAIVDEATADALKIYQEEKDAKATLETFVGKKTAKKAPVKEEKPEEKSEEKKEETKTETPSTEEEKTSETTKKAPAKATGNAKNPNKSYRIGVWEASQKIFTSILFNGRLGDKVLTFNQKEYLRQLKTDLDYFKDLEIIKNPVEKNQPRNFNKAAKDKNMSDGVRNFLQTIMSLETEETLKDKIAELSTQTADALVKETIKNYIELTKEELAVIEETVPTSDEAE